MNGWQKLDIKRVPKYQQPHLYQLRELSRITLLAMLERNGYKHEAFDIIANVPGESLIVKEKLTGVVYVLLDREILAKEERPESSTN